jgi:preprotein translocase subunit SecE
MAKDKRPQTGGLQEKKVKLPPTKEEVKQEQKEEKAKRASKRKERRKDKPSIWQRIKDVFAELKKVRWPSAKETLKHTGIVLAVVAIFSLVVFGIDFGLLELLKLLTRGTQL